MKRLDTRSALEAVVGTQSQTMLMKSIDELDEGSCLVVAHSPIAALGFRDDDGFAHSTFVGGRPGFMRVNDSTRITFERDRELPPPANASGMSMLFLLPGIGETLRLTARVSDVAEDQISAVLEEAWVHCAKCILRSKLWEPHPAPAEQSSLAARGATATVTAALEQPYIARFLSETPFIVVSSWDAAGSSDTSPRGDRSGFVRVLPDGVLAIPDRKGNRRTDTFHNLLECDQVAIAAVIPGSTEVLHLSGTAYATNEEDILVPMAVGETPPKAAMMVHVESAHVTTNRALGASGLWAEDSHVDKEAVPDLMQLGALHLARSKTKGTKASMTRLISRGAAKSPGFLRRGVDSGYRKELTEEGY